MTTYYTSAIKTVANEAGIIAPRPDLVAVGIAFTPGVPTQIIPIFYGATEIFYRVETDE